MMIKTITSFKRPDGVTYEASAWCNGGLVARAAVWRDSEGWKYKVTREMGGIMGGSRFTCNGALDAAKNGLEKYLDDIT